MVPLWHPLRFLLVALAGWINQQQRDVIDYLQEENRVLREQLGPGRLRFTDAVRIAVKRINDRPHVVRATSVVRLWKGVRLAANLQRFSGKPWAATTPARLPQGSRRILLEPRGTRRLSSQSLVDLRVSKTLPVFGAATADLILDVLNVLNDTGEEALVSDNRFADTFGTPKLFIDPRRAMLGVRLNLGR
jgi:hypothetical protein